MQEIDPEFLRFIRSIAPAGNLFLLLTLPELRREGLTYAAFYMLQRIIREPGRSERSFSTETGLKDYEVSRSCRFLEKSGLVRIDKGEADARTRLLSSTPRGRRICDKVFSAAAQRLQRSRPAAASMNQFAEAIDMFRVGNELLLGPIQFSLFYQGPREPARVRRTEKKQRTGHSK